MKRVLSAAIVGIVSGISSSVVLAASADSGPRYSCSFGSGASWSVDSATFKAGKGAPLAFEISKVSRKKRTAELTTKSGRTEVKLVAAIDALHFIEVTVSGYLSLTTIYGDGDRMPAVHSRHLGIVGQPVGGQLTGFCDRK